jgi:hypothetical protein
VGERVPEGRVRGKRARVRASVLFRNPENAMEPRDKRGQLLPKTVFPARRGPELGRAIMVRRHSVTRRRRVLVRASAAGFH